MALKMMLIVNPCAGKLRAKSSLLDLIDIFSDCGYDVTVFPTKKDINTAATVAKKSRKYDTVVCCGGDGTLSEVICGLMISKRRLPLGFIPMGTTNDFARTMNIPTNPRDAAKCIVRNNIVEYDIGHFNDRKYFTYIAAVGAFTSVAYETPQNLKNALGHMAYLVEGFWSIDRISPLRLRVLCDGKLYEGDYIYASVSNTTSVGGIIRLNESDILTNDGSFELLLIKYPSDAKEFIELISDILNKKHNSKLIKLLHAKEVHFYSSVAYRWTLDGENGGSHREVSICNMKKALRLFCKNEGNQ